MARLALDQMRKIWDELVAYHTARGRLNDGKDWHNDSEKLLLDSGWTRDEVWNEIIMTRSSPEVHLNLLFGRKVVNEPN